MNEDFYIGDLEAAIFIDAPAGENEPRFVFYKTIVNSFIKEVRITTFFKSYQRLNYTKEQMKRFWKEYIRRDFEA